MLSEGGAHITDTGNMGTSLLYAAARGRLFTVQWLLSEEGGASITDRNATGCTALILAAERGHATLCTWLIEVGGADIADLNLLGHTVWTMMAENMYEIDLWLWSPCCKFCCCGALLLERWLPSCVQSTCGW
jgi:hypothetical protein